MKRISAEVIAVIFDKAADNTVSDRRQRGQATTAVCHRTRKAFIHTATPRCRCPVPAALSKNELLSVYCEQQPRQLRHEFHFRDAKALGLSFPQTLIVSADEVIA
jgi:hypothetical protein